MPCDRRAGPPRGRCRRGAPTGVRPPDCAAPVVVAGRFLRSYLQFAYGRARARSVKAVTPGLRSRLIARARPGHAGRARAATRGCVSLRMLGTNPGFVVATAIVEDGGIAAYRLRLRFGQEGGRWLVSDVQEG